MFWRFPGAPVISDTNSATSSQNTNTHNITYHLQNQQYYHEDLPPVPPRRPMNVPPTVQPTPRATMSSVIPGVSTHQDSPPAGRPVPPPRPGAPAPHTFLENTRGNGHLPTLPPTPMATPGKNIRELGPEKAMSFFRLQDFTLVRPLGTGTFGRVFLARYGSLNKYFALKRMRKVDVYRLKQLEHVQNERSILSRLNHPFIIRLYAALQDERHLYFLMEYAPGGELFHYLRKVGRLTPDAARFYIAELVLALEYLHAHDIAYRDLKPENLLLDQDGHLKLADFGFVKMVPDVTYTLCGTPEYLAPEIILGHGYGRGVDWWALGILLYEMLTGNPPFNGATPTAVYENTLKGRIHFPQAMQRATVELITGLLTPDVHKRLGCTGTGASAIKQMKYFRGIDWDIVYRRAYRPPIIPPPGDAELAVNFPLDDSKSSMDVVIPNEDAFLKAHGGTMFPGFAK